jgi:pullulanase
MGLHDLKTMQKVEEAIHTVNPEAVIYGEGWTMGSTIDGSKQANQTNISQITPSNNAIGTIAVFNDAIRDGLKGSVFSQTSRGYISGSYGAEILNKVKFGIQGGSTSGIGWKVNNSMVVNYMSAHDNHTLWDKLLLSNPENSEAERMAMNRLGAGIIMVSKGMPFIHAGEEMLRTKNGDENSYKSSDAINNIDWEALSNENVYQTMLYYKGLIEMRKAYSIFYFDTAYISFTSIGNNGAMAIRYRYHTSKQEAIVILNPSNSEITYDLTGDWKLIANGSQAGSEAIKNATGTITVNPIELQVYVNH